MAAITNFSRDPTLKQQFVDRGVVAHLTHGLDQLEPDMLQVGRASPLLNSNFKILLHLCLMPTAPSRLEEFSVANRSSSLKPNITPKEKDDS